MWRKEKFLKALEEHLLPAHAALVVPRLQLEVAVAELLHAAEELEEDPLRRTLLNYCAS